MFSEEGSLLANELRELDNKRRAIEDEIKVLTDFLTSDGMPGLKGNLVDEEEFPRADIDVYAVRVARNKIACLNTDYTMIMEQIEEKLHTLHKTDKVSIPTVKTASLPSLPFARVESVQENSPASTAGLIAGDLIIEFSTLKCTSHTERNATFKKLGSVLIENSEVTVIVERLVEGGLSKVLKLTPRKNWGGNGMLGCHVVPVV